MNEDKEVTVGIIGGGQLGRMMALEAPRLGVKTRVLDAGGANSPCGFLCAGGVVEGGLKDVEKLRELARGCDVVTAEIEHISVDALAQLELEGTNVQPSSGIIRLIQDKLVQKEHFRAHGIPLAPYRDCPTVAAVKEAAAEFGLPLMLKSRKEGYDGRGNLVLRDMADVDKHFSSLTQSGGKGGVYAEKWVPFVDELAVMVVRSTAGEVRAYTTVTAVQRHSVCRVVVAPARCPTDARERAERVAMDAISSLGNGASGVFGVELFLLADGAVMLNEVAPRPHNTGHYTQDACSISQFENHLRGVCGFPLGDTSMAVGAAAMVNVLGAAEGLGATLAVMNTAMTMPRCIPHWYGKGWRRGRKMGHINVTADSAPELEGVLCRLLQGVGLDAEGGRDGGRIPPPQPLVGVIMGSDSDLPAMQAAVKVLEDFGVAYECDIVSAHRTPEKMMAYAQRAAARGLECIIAGAGGAAHLPGMVASMTPLPVVGVPIKTSTMNGQDSLYSIVQMPRGIPVATVAIGNAQNAGLLAVRILASTRVGLRKKMEGYQRGLKEVVEGKSEGLVAKGVASYLADMPNKSATVNV